LGRNSNNKTPWEEIQTTKHLGKKFNQQQNAKRNNSQVRLLNLNENNSILN